VPINEKPCYHQTCGDKVACGLQETHSTCGQFAEFHFFAYETDGAEASHISKPLSLTQR
jgi:hypothetical protein